MVEFLKNKKRVAIIGGALAVAIIVGAISISANASMSVNSYIADTGELSSTLELNGTVETDNCKTFYSKVNGTIGTVHVKEGDFVKKGDVIISYDADDLERLTAIAECNAEADLGSYNDMMQAGNRTAGLYGEAKRNIGVLDQQITDTQAAITQLQKDLTKRKAEIAEWGVKLQISFDDYADQPDSEEFKNLHEQLQQNAYDQQYDSEIVRLQEEINNLNIQLAGYKEYKAEMTSQKAATQMNLMTNGEKEKLEAVKTANELSSNDVIEDYKDAAKGIRADFDGVVTSIAVVEGSSVYSGDELAKIESIGDVVVKLNVNKYDIIDIEEGQYASVVIKNKEYSGKVTRIEKKTKDPGQNTGIGVEVKLDEPDSNIILGMEVKAKVRTADAEKALRVPLSALWEDEEGSFVFVAKDGKAVKTAVETGIRNDDMVEIRSGISEGDIVVWNDAAEIADQASIKINK